MLRTYARLTLLLVLAACSAPGAGSAPTLAVETAAPSPTLASTPSPTASPAPSATLLPSDTPTPLPPTPTPTQTPVPLTTFLFTGVIVPARCVQAAIDEVGSPDFVYDEVRDLIQAADVAVGTLNATISAVPEYTGCRRTYLLVGRPDNADAMQRAGFDVMSVATNHIKNCGLPTCGNQAFFDTLDNLRRVGILPVGAGQNHAEAMQPVVVEKNGVRFGIVSLGQIEPMAFAGEDTPGIAILNDANLRDAIAAARAVSDVVIAMPHWGPETAPVPNWIQRNLARTAVESGADLVVGNHTHVVQAHQEIDGVRVFYGLGNFVFDQDWSVPTSQGVILQVTFQGTQMVGYEFIPVHIAGTGKVSIAGPEEAAQIMDRIEEASRAIGGP
jgi:poly-gamma-glutamate capsule biosynthesis protein CapA/YwtB (metallophosphatase superfamily)